eukprot:gene6504-biopygen6550
MEGVNRSKSAEIRQWHRFCRQIAHIDKDSAPAETATAAKTVVSTEHLRYGRVARRDGLATDERCSLWLPQKKRFCSRPQLAGTTLCCQHQLKESESVSPAAKPPSQPEREPCPHCMTLLLPAKLSSHISKRCEAAQRQVEMEQQVFFHRGVNSGEAHSPAERADLLETP